MNKISLILPSYPKDRIEKRGIITSFITGFIGLAYKGISTYLHNSDTLEKFITTVHQIHNATTWYEILFTGKCVCWNNWYLSKDGVSNYAIHSLLHLRTMREKYVQMYKEFISYLCMHEKAIRILSKGYLPISLLPPLKL